MLLISLASGRQNAFQPTDGENDVLLQLIISSLH